MPKIRKVILRYLLAVLLAINGGKFHEILLIFRYYLLTFVVLVLSTLLHNGKISSDNRLNSSPLIMFSLDCLVIYFDRSHKVLH